MSVIEVDSLSDAVNNYATQQKFNCIVEVTADKNQTLLSSKNVKSVLKVVSFNEILTQYISLSQHVDLIICKGIDQLGDEEKKRVISWMVKLRSDFISISSDDDDTNEVISALNNVLPELVWDNSSSGKQRMQRLWTTVNLIHSLSFLSSFITILNKHRICEFIPSPSIVRKEEPQSIDQQVETLDLESEHVEIPTIEEEKSEDIIQE